MHKEYNAKNENKFALTVVNHDDTIKPANRFRTTSRCVVFVVRCEYLNADHYISAPGKTSTYPKKGQSAEEINIKRERKEERKKPTNTAQEEKDET